MPVFQAGSINTTALIVPDLYVQIVPPRVSMLNGVPTNGLGIVGIASWGPTNSPVPISSMGDYAAAFGPVLPAKFDMGTAVAAAVLQGANNMTCVRATDGTEVAASATLACGTPALATALADAINKGTSVIRGPSQLIVASANASNLTLTAFYTGALGNSIICNVGAGSAATTTKITFCLPGGIPEVFDNVGITSQAASSPAFTGGANGNTTITSTVLVGVDTFPRKGMYALRNTNVSIALLADADDTTVWTNQAAFGQAEGIYMILTGPAGQTPTTAVTAKSTAGIDNYDCKIMMGDWVYFNDTVNKQLRLISPQGFVAGRLANLSPEQSSLNKPLYGIVATQTSQANRVYSSAELAILAAASIDVIANPCPGGKFFGCRVGHNSSSDPTRNGDNYTRMTNYIAYTLNAGMGRFVGRVGTPSERKEAADTLRSFFSKMKSNRPDPMIDDFKVEDIPPLSNGYQIANVQVKYLDIVEKFVINVEGGTTVQITHSPA